jgi:hypothetical protein
MRRGVIARHNRSKNGIAYDEAIHQSKFSG